MGAGDGRLDCQGASRLLKHMLGYYLLPVYMGSSNSFILKISGTGYYGNYFMTIMFYNELYCSVYVKFSLVYYSVGWGGQGEGCLCWVGHRLAK